MSVIPNIGRLCKDVRYGSSQKAHLRNDTTAKFIEENSYSDDSDLSEDRGRKKGCGSEKRSEGSATDRAVSLPELATSRKESPSTSSHAPKNDLRRLLQRLSLGTSPGHKIFIWNAYQFPLIHP